MQLGLTFAVILTGLCQSVLSTPTTTPAAQCRGPAQLAKFVVDDPSVNYLRDLLDLAGADGVEAVSNLAVGFWFDNFSHVDCRV
ncbi:hypothetical protein MCOR27_000915 [Pyricularia oryzae]|nr:hypothetical protein MCOR27_000915 [Pyricularia oryzae]KAI6444823.1 hypothetical protein MCOR22_004606 [Pyricularia oryzae]KAI6520847.1 hypothetical protein MCOR05_010699 [Pyricularia oryzae]